jgi:hypothetical protein
MTAPRLRPHTLRLCIHCRQTTAGSWVSRNGGMPTRPPWCPFCCQALDPGRYHAIPFEDQGDAGRFR